MRVWLLFLPCPPLLQTRGRSPTPHAWWHCPPALLPLASGDICGGRAHCGPDHLCQEPGGQGRSHEEAQVLLTGRRIVGSHARAEAVPSGQRSPAPQSPRLVAQEMEGAAARPPRGPFFSGGRNRHSWKSRELITCIPRAVAVAKGPSS